MFQGASDGTVHVWDLRTGSKSQRITCSNRLIQDMELSRGILTVASGDTVSIFDGRTFDLEKVHRMPINFNEEGGASLHPDGSKFIAVSTLLFYKVCRTLTPPPPHFILQGGSDVWVRVFDRKTGCELECNKGHHGPVRCLRYAPDGLSYATGL